MEILYSIFVAPFIEMGAYPDLFIQALWDGFVSGTLYGLIALGFVLIFKASGVFNFSQPILVVLAALSLVSFYQMGIPAWISVILVLVMSITAGLSLYLTQTRIRAPSVATATLFGFMSFIVYVGGFDLPLVFGVGAAGLIGVFPVALVSPRSKNKGIGARALPTITCPSCNTPNVVHSSNRPFRTSCSGCFVTLRLD